MKRLILTAPYLIVISVFGPYVLPEYGIRTEQLTIYALALLLGMYGLHARLRASRILVHLLGWWGLILGLAVAVSLASGVLLSNIGKFYSGIDDYLLPICLGIVLIVFVSEVRRRQESLVPHLVKLARLLCLLVFVNTVVMFGQTFVDLSGLLKPFWASEFLVVEGQSVAERALRMGRITGIFNSPAQHGMIYSITLFAHLFILLEKRKMTLVELGMLTANLVAGFFSASKIYLFCGLPLVLAYATYMFIMQQSSYRRVYAVVGLLGVLGLGALGLQAVIASGQWAGSAHIVSYLENTDYVYGITAGRFSSDGEGTLIVAMREVIDVDWIFGTGFGYLQAVDNQLLSIFMCGGLVGVVLFSLFVLVILARVLKACPPGLPKFRYQMVRLYVGIVLLAGVGAPVFTTNRASTVLWIVLLLFMAMLESAANERKAAVVTAMRAPAMLGR